MQENRYNTCDRFLGGLEKDFIITEQIEDSPLTSEPSFLDYGIIAVCNRGSAIIHLLDNKHVWNKNELIFLFPRQLCSMRNGLLGEVYHHTTCTTWGCIKFLTSF